MAYSGSTNFSVTRDQIIQRAAAKLGIIDSGNGETLSTNESTDFAFQLNVLVKAAMAKGAGNLWVRNTGTLFLTPGKGYDQNPFTLGNSSTDNWTYNTVVTTQVAATVSSGTSLVVSSVAGLSATMNIGIKLDTGAFFWTTIASINTGTLTITLNSAITSSVTAGNYVYCYAVASSPADRPQRILEVYRRFTNGNLDVILSPISRQVYSTMSNKQLQTIPVQWHYENTIPNGNFFVWPLSNGTSGYDQLIIVAEGLLEDFDSGTDNPWFPIEWVNYLIYELAVQMAPEYDIPQGKIQMLQGKAIDELNTLLDYSSTTSQSPLQFGLSQDSGWNFDWRGG